MSLQLFVKLILFSHVDNSCCYFVFHLLTAINIIGFNVKFNKAYKTDKKILLSEQCATMILFHQFS